MHALTVITIRNVPPEPNDRLKERARERGQSLQQFLLAELADVAERSPLETRLREALGRGAGGDASVDSVTQALDAARTERDARLAELAKARG